MAQNEKDTAAKGDPKVELDLDDAPFLADEPTGEDTAPDAPEDAPPPAASPAVKPGAEAKPPLRKKKKIIFAVAGGVLLLLVAAAVYFFVFARSKSPSPPPPVSAPASVTAEEVPAPPPPPQEYVLQWEPFWVGLKDTEGAVRFLTLTFSITTQNPIVFAEMNAKRLVLRDALFYYLRNQPIISLSNTEKANELKSDLLTVVNEHLGSGKVSELLIQDYLLQ